MTNLSFIKVTGLELYQEYRYQGLGPRALAEKYNISLPEVYKRLRPYQGKRKYEVR